MSVRPPKAVNSWCGRPTLTPTITPTVTPKQLVYVSLCTSGSADNSGSLIVYAYTDSISSSFGNNPVSIDTSITISLTVDGNLTPNVLGSIVISSGNYVGNTTLTDFNSDEIITAMSLDSIIPSSSSTQIYLNGGTSIGSSCIVVTPTPTPTITPTISVTPTLTPSISVTPTSTGFICNDCRYWEYNTVPIGGDVIYYYSCTDGSIQTIAVNNGDTGNFCNCNSIGNPYTDNGSQLTEIGICVTPTPTPTSTLNEPPAP